MSRAPASFSVDDHFEGKVPNVRKVYAKLVATIRKLGPFHEEPKKASIHLSRSSALAGVQVRKGYLVLIVKSDRAIKSPRVHKSEQVSVNRFHHELKLSSTSQIDKELQSWLKAAYELSA